MSRTPPELACAAKAHRGGLLLAVLVRRRRQPAARPRLIKIQSAQDLFRGEDLRLARKLELVPNIHQGLGEAIDQCIVMIR